MIVVVYVNAMEWFIDNYRSMDFCEVEHYHGGPNRHRDVEPGAMGEWENFTVVVKRGKINARASGQRKRWKNRNSGPAVFRRSIREQIDR
jgi:hypothetical protein